MEPKKLTDQQLLGERGISLIATKVAEMGFLWRPTTTLDTGIDGEIELRDASTGEMSGLIVKVQSKAVSRFENETPEGFDCHASDPFSSRLSKVGAKATSDSSDLREHDLPQYPTLHQWPVAGRRGARQPAHALRRQTHDLRRLRTGGRSEGLSGGGDAAPGRATCHGGRLAQLSARRQVALGRRAVHPLRGPAKRSASPQCIRRMSALGALHDFTLPARSSHHATRYFSSAFWSAVAVD